MKASLISFLLAMAVTLQSLPPANRQALSQNWGMPEPVAIRRNWRRPRLV